MRNRKAGQPVREDKVAKDDSAIKSAAILASKNPRQKKTPLKNMNTLKSAHALKTKSALKEEDTLKFDSLNLEDNLLSVEDLPWKTTAETEEQQAKREAEERQQRIINFFTADERVEVTPEEIVGMDKRGLKELKRKRANELRRQAMQEETLKSTREQRKSVLMQMAAGVITGKDENNFLLLVPDGLQGDSGRAEEVFREIAKDQRQVQMLALALGKTAATWQQVDSSALEKILQAVQPDGDDYRTPVGFMKLRRHFLSGIRAKAKIPVYRAYVAAMNQLERNLYGERMEYFREFELLRQEAKQYMEPTTAVMKLPEVKYEALTPERSAAILSQAMIEGDTWYGGGIERHLSIHNLTVAKLTPMISLTLDGVEIALSDLFQVAAGRIAVIAYVVTRNAVKVRAYYRTNTQGMWRYLPDYTRRVDGQIDFYCLGYGVESVTLPTVLQMTLAELEAKRGVRVLDNAADAEFLVGGTTYAYDTRQEYQMQWSYGRMRGDYYQEVSAEPINHDFVLSNNHQKKAPYTLSIDYQRLPDFQQKIAEFTIEVADIGAATVEGFCSHDGQYNWLFCQDAKGRVWIGAVEAISPITSTGLRRDYLMMGDLMTPLYEPTSQAGIYGDRNDTKGARQCMWNNYLSNIPLIQEYLRYKEKTL